jgi:hypothetical protein
VRRISIVVVGLAFAVGAAAAQAKDTPASVSALAEQQAKDGRLAEAAASYAKAAALAQDARDLEAEHEAVAGLETVLGRTKEGAERQGALAGAAAALPAKRTGAIVAARGLALRALFEAVLSGDPAGVADAAAVAAVPAKLGKGGAQVAAFADAMELVVARKPEAAAAALEKASDAAFAERFDDLALFAALEAAAQRLAADDAAAARAAFERAARVFADGKDAWMSNAWNRAKRGRFASVAPETTQPLTDALGGATSASAAGGRGGRGGHGGSGGDDLSPVGRAMVKAARKPIASVKRTAEGWETSAAWSADPPEKHAFENGFRIVEGADGGLFWMLSGRSHTVTVRQISRKVTEAGPGESSEPPIARPRWHLAEGESISLFGDGTVEVSR